jgi:hypothetical protein
VLACRSVLDGFAAYDSIKELSQRINELPPELEQLFQHMLRGVEPRYYQQTAKDVAHLFPEAVINKGQVVPSQMRTRIYPDVRNVLVCSRQRRNGL